MSVTPGSKISVTDMAALATLANSKSSLVNYVSPLYTDGSGNPYGYQAFSLVYIDPLNPGTDYKPGDILSLGFGSAFEVEMVSATGGVLGIRVQNYGAGQYSDTATSPLLVTGGSGTGCRFYFSFLQVGPTASYSFPDFLPNQGVVTGFYLVSGGIGYIAGETITFTELTGLSLTVGTVDGTGKILTFSMVPSYIAVTIPQNVAAMNAVGTPGTGAQFGGYFILSKNPQWLTELNRLRGNLDRLNLTGKFGGVTTCNSGPWPVGGPTDNFKDTNFYYPDTGNVESVTLENFFSESSGTFTTATRKQAYYPGSPSDMWYLKTYIFLNHIEATFIIGGVDPVLVTGDFTMNAEWVRGGEWSSGTFVPDGIDPTSLIHVSGTFPGTPSITYSGSGPLPVFANFTNSLTSPVIIKYSVSQYLPPGRYTIIVDVDMQPDDAYNTGTYTSVMFDAIGSNGQTVSGNATAGFVYHTATDYNGIHNTKGIKKINVPGDGIGASDGIYNVIQETTNDSSWTNSPYPQPTFGPERIFATEMSITTSVAGLWTAYCQMVSSLNSVTPGNMPWNLQRTKYGSSGNATVNPSLLGDLADNISNVGKVSNSYDQSLPVELQAEPPGWIANRYFTAGFTIMDGNGNLQICGRSGISGATSPSWGTSDGSYTVEPYGADPRYNLGWKCVQALTSTGSWSAGASISAGQTIKDSNGNTQFSASGGITGATVPTWPTRVGSITTDGTVQWQTRCPFTPAIHRPQSIPVYPFYWQGNNTFPTTWVAATAYALNATVIDANGNTQQCTTAGTSAATAPVWSQTLASVTSDGATLKWTLITLAAETNAFQKPPTATSGLTRWGANNQWQRNNWNGSTNYDLGWQADNLAFGWWIYSVSINRMILNPANQVSVTIGCIRNGSFVAFGTWDTGQTIQVLWPIFTSDALVYQCGERVDIQAVAIASGGAGVSTGATASEYPICAAFVSDTTALLNLL